MQDWKDKLSALTGVAVPVPENEEPVTLNPKSVCLCISYQKRNGKLATILTGHPGSDEEVKDLARQLKSALAIGGSVRDGEILLQGDVRQKAKEFLQKQGYKTKGV